MLTLAQRVDAVLEEAWQRLPPLKRDAAISRICIEDLGRHHGSYSPSSHELVLNSRLFTGDYVQAIPLIDINGQCPPRVEPCCSRAVHTAIHEAAHAIGESTGLDESPAWLAISGWVEAPDDPDGTARYQELRPGWGNEETPWRHTAQTWFVRPYASKSPYEDFADCVAHYALGWFDFLLGPMSAHPSGIAKLAYLRREVWGERGVQAIAAASQRWQRRFFPVAAATPVIQSQRTRRRTVTDDEDEDDLDETADRIIEAVQTYNAEQERRVLRALPGGLGAVRAAITEDDQHQFGLAVGPLLLALSRNAWRRGGGALDAWEAPENLQGHLDGIDRMARSYTSTTRRQVLAALMDAEEAGATPGELQRIVRGVYDAADARRAFQVAWTEGRRTVQVTKRSLWATEGVTALEWRTTSGNPCEFCQSLEGMRVGIGEAFAEEGETLTSARGKEMTLDYGTLEHPPLHVNCQCQLVPVGD